MGVSGWVAGLAFTGIVCAQGFLPVSEIRPGMQGTGKSVFSGSRVEEFRVEILGVLENIGPKQNLILARLSGGPLRESGVLQGMSGSPVYVAGKLVGAVAMAFPFSKEPIAGIRPIEEMLNVGAAVRPGSARSWPPGEPLALVPAGTQPVSLPAGMAGREQMRLVDIATPVAFGGFTRATIEHFGAQLRALGLEPRQGTSGGGRLAQGMGRPAALEPGSMISVQLLSGDMSVGADGTVTHVDGRKIYAFGHRFLSVGGTELPFARSEVLALLPSIATSFKISSPREWMGTITDDRNTAVAGEIGRRAVTVPLRISVLSQAQGQAAPRRTSYRMEMVRDRYLSPFLVQMAVFSSIDATERTIGVSSFGLRGEIEFDGVPVPVRLNNMYSGEFNVPVQASLGAATPLAYALQSGFDGLIPRAVNLDIVSYGEKKQAQIGQVWTSRREVRPGESVELTVVLTGDNGAEWVRKASYTVPAGATPGPLFFTVADAMTINLTEFRNIPGAPPRTADQVVSLLNELRGNTNAYVRIWRADPSYQVQGEDLPAPPPSVAMILGRGQSALGNSTPGRTSKLAEFKLNAGDLMVSGAKTVQVDVKE